MNKLTFSVVVLLSATGLVLGEENPYAPPNFTQSHPRDSCVGLGLQIELNSIDAKLTKLFQNVEYLSKSNLVSVKKLEITRGPDSADSHVVVVRLPDDIRLESVNESIKSSVAGVRKSFEKLKRRAAGNLTAKNSIVCGFHFCFRVLGMASLGSTTAPFLSNLALGRPFSWSPLELQALAREGALYGVLVGLASSAAFYSNVLAPKMRRVAHRKALEDMIRDIQKIVESGDLPNGPHTFLVITHADKIPGEE